MKLRQKGPRAAILTVLVVAVIGGCALIISAESDPLVANRLRLEDAFPPEEVSIVQDNGLFDPAQGRVLRLGMTRAEVEAQTGPGKDLSEEEFSRVKPDGTQIPAAIDVAYTSYHQDNLLVGYLNGIAFDFIAGNDSPLPGAGQSTGAFPWMNVDGLTYGSSWKAMKSLDKNAYERQIIPGGAVGLEGYDADTDLLVVQTNRLFTDGAVLTARAVQDGGLLELRLTQSEYAYGWFSFVSLAPVPFQDPETGAVLTLGMLQAEAEQQLGQGRPLKVSAYEAELSSCYEYGEGEQAVRVGYQSGRVASLSLGFSPEESPAWFLDALPLADLPFTWEAAEGLGYGSAESDLRAQFNLSQTWQWKHVGNYKIATVQKLGVHGFTLRFVLKEGRLIKLTQSSAGFSLDGAAARSIFNSATDTQLRLNMVRADVEALLGPGTQDSDGSYVYGQGADRLRVEYAEEHAVGFTTWNEGLYTAPASNWQSCGVAWGTDRDALLEAVPDGHYTGLRDGDGVLEEATGSYTLTFSLAGNQVKVIRLALPQW